MRLIRHSISSEVEAKHLHGLQATHHVTTVEVTQSRTSIVMHSLGLQSFQKGNANSTWSSHLGEPLPRGFPHYMDQYEIGICCLSPANMVGPPTKHNQSSMSPAEYEKSFWMNPVIARRAPPQTPDIWGKSAKPSETTAWSLFPQTTWRSDHLIDPKPAAWLGPKRWNSVQLQD